MNVKQFTCHKCQEEFWEVLSFGDMCPDCVAKFRKPLR